MNKEKLIHTYREILIFLCKGHTYFFSQNEFSSNQLLDFKNYVNDFNNKLTGFLKEEKIDTGVLLSMKEEFFCMKGIQESISEYDSRKKGHSTRLIDECIQELFTNPEGVCVIDHCYFDKAHDDLFKRVLRRLKFEHSWIIDSNQLQVDKEKRILKLSKDFFEQKERKVNFLQRIKAICNVNN